MASLEEKSPNEEGACAAPPEELELELDNGGDCDLDGCIEDSMHSELTCKICQDTMQNAKMLSCFHTFCQTCLENVVKKEISKIDGEPIKTPDTVTCPDCMQMTSLPSGKVENLMTNLLLEDRLNPSQDNPAIICSSCKAKEKAVAHCAKCPNFLCTNCMAVVESFEEILKSGGTIAHQKPVCRKHAEENLVSFCNVCQVPVCQKCMVVVHVLPEHPCVPLSEVEGLSTAYLKSLMARAHLKLTAVCEASESMADLTDLQDQKEHAQGLINETFQSIEACLENIRDEFLAELALQHSKMELVQMETSQSRANIETRLESACEMSYPGRPFNVWNADRSSKKSLLAISLADLVDKGCGKLGMPNNNVRVVLEEDGTEVDEEDYFRFLNGDTVLMLLHSDDRWRPAGHDAAVQGPELSQHVNQLLAFLKRDVTSISIFSDDDLQSIVDLEDRRLAFELKKSVRYARVMHEECQRYLDERERVQDAFALLHVYHKGEAPNFNTREFITNRKALEAALFKAVRERLGGICCAKDCNQYKYACPQGCKKYSLCDDKTEKGLWVYVKYFQLGSVDIPSDVEDRFLKALTLKEEAAREEQLQDAQVYRKKTEADVQNIQNKALEIRQEAQAQAQMLSTVAAANYTATVEKARAQGLKSLYQRLGLNTQELKNSFDYLRTLRTLETAHFTVDFQQRIVGGFSGN